MPSVMDTFRTRHMPNPQPDKWVKPSEIAELLCSLCSDELGSGKYLASYKLLRVATVTAEIRVDRGRGSFPVSFAPWRRVRS